MQKYLVDQFVRNTLTAFQQYCFRHTLSPTNENFLTYLYDRELLNENNMRRYIIMEEYDQMHILPTFKKTQAVRKLADKYQLSDRAIWNIIARK